MKETLKTLLEGTKHYVDSRVNPLSVTENDSLILVTELGLVTPIADDDNCVFTDENGVIYTL